MILGCLRRECPCVLWRISRPSVSAWLHQTHDSLHSVSRPENKKKKVRCQMFCPVDRVNGHYTQQHNRFFPWLKLPRRRRQVTTWPHKMAIFPISHRGARAVTSCPHTLLVLRGPKCAKKISPTPLHHHQQPEPLRQGRMDPCFHGLYAKFWPYYLNVAAEIETHQTRQHSSNLYIQYI